MGRFLDYATAKLGMADALRAMIAAGGDPYGNSQELTLEAISVLRHACESRTESDANRQKRGAWRAEGGGVACTCSTGQVCVAGQGADELASNLETDATAVPPRLSIRMERRFARVDVATGSATVDLDRNADWDSASGTAGEDPSGLDPLSALSNSGLVHVNSRTKPQHQATSRYGQPSQSNRRLARQIADLALDVLLVIGDEQAFHAAEPSIKRDLLEPVIQLNLPLLGVG
jgi:hypothetical protein